MENSLTSWPTGGSSRATMFQLTSTLPPLPLLTRFGSQCLLGSSDIKSLPWTDEYFSIANMFRKILRVLLTVIPKEKFHKCLQKWQQCWAKCTAAQRHYIKDDPSHCAEIYRHIVFWDFTATSHTHKNVIPLFPVSYPRTFSSPVSVLAYLLPPFLYLHYLCYQLWISYTSCRVTKMAESVKHSS